MYEPKSKQPLRCQNGICNLRKKLIFVSRHTKNKIFYVQTAFELENEILKLIAV
jgi:hypothetical protein